MKPWHEYTPIQVERLAEEAIDNAIQHIQREMGILSGDAAALFFQGDKYRTMVEEFKDYVRFEIRLYRNSIEG